MRVSYSEDLASRAGPESCVAVREGSGQALTGDRAGRVLSRERGFVLRRRRSPLKRKATSDSPQTRGGFESRAVVDPAHARKHFAHNLGDPVFGQARVSHLLRRCTCLAGSHRDSSTGIPHRSANLNCNREGAVENTVRFCVPNTGDTLTLQRKVVSPSSAGNMQKCYCRTLNAVFRAAKTKRVC